MAPTLSARRVELLRKLATKEAARRQQQQQQQHQSEAEQTRESHAGPSSVTIEEIDAFEEHDRQLERILLEERAKNDVEWDNVQRKLASLDAVPNDRKNQNSSLANKETELAILEHDIEVLNGELPRLDAPQNSFILSLLTRDILSTSIEECTAGIHLKRKDLEKEKYHLRQDEETWQQLQDVQEGLEIRKEKLRQRSAEKQDPKSVIKTLRKDAAAAGSNTKSLMTFLIQFCDTLYEEDKEITEQKFRMGYQLRHLIDVLVNKAYDRPHDAWVDVSQHYSPSIVNLLVRANIALEHPRDSRSLRLVDFSR